MSADLAELELAQTVLNPNEYAVWILSTRGLGRRRIADALGLADTTVKDRLRNAARKLAQAEKEPAA